MADPKKTEYPTIQDIKSPLDLGKFNPVGRDVPEVKAA